MRLQKVAELVSQFFAWTTEMRYIRPSSRKTATGGRVMRLWVSRRNRHINALDLYGDVCKMDPVDVAIL